MSTMSQQLNTATESYSTQSTVLIQNNKNYTILLSDLQKFIPSLNAVLKPEYQLNKVGSFKDLTDVLTRNHLKLKNKTVELNPVVATNNSLSISFDDELDKDQYLGFDSITVKTLPLEDIIIPMLTPDMLTQSSDGYEIMNTRSNFCGINQVEIQDIALAIHHIV